MQLLAQFYVCDKSALLFIHAGTLQLVKPSFSYHYHVALAGGTVKLFVVEWRSIPGVHTH